MPTLEPHLNWQKLEIPYRQDCSDFFERLLSFPYPVWLDSCGGHSPGRHEILCCAPSSTLKNTHEAPSQFLDEVRKASPKTYAEVAGIAFSGLVGFMGYEFGVKLHGLATSNPSTHSLPSAWFGFYQWAVIVDHALAKAFIIYCDENLFDDVTVGMLKSWWFSTDKHISSSSFLLNQPFKANIAYEKYQAALDEIHRHILQGDTYQVNYTQAFQAKYDGDPFHAYKLLRKQNPAEYASFMRLPEGDVLSFSPELLIRAEQKHLISKPIKGTAARFHSPSVDQLQQQKLKQCPKNRAENMMIVDLMRNDLSRVALADSVNVAKFLDIETFPSVFHLVSTITADMNGSADYFDVLQEIFPGGSITGAPKYRTMQLINNYEYLARGVYCGSIGYISADQDMCFNIAIRTMTASNGLMSCPAGGGIVLDSIASDEYQETHDKVAGFMKTFHRLINEKTNLSTFSKSTAN